MKGVEARPLNGARGLVPRGRVQTRRSPRAGGYSMCQLPPYPLGLPLLGVRELLHPTSNACLLAATRAL